MMLRYNKRDIFILSLSAKKYKIIYISSLNQVISNIYLELVNLPGLQRTILRYMYITDKFTSYGNEYLSINLTDVYNLAHRYTGRINNNKPEGKWIRNKSEMNFINGKLRGKFTGFHKNFFIDDNYIYENIGYYNNSVYHIMFAKNPDNNSYIYLGGYDSHNNYNEYDKKIIISYDQIIYVINNQVISTHFIENSHTKYFNRIMDDIINSLNPSFYTLS